MNRDDGEYYMTYQQLVANQQVANNQANQQQQQLTRMPPVQEDELPGGEEGDRTAYRVSSENAQIFSNHHPGVLTYFGSSIGEEYLYNNPQTTSHEQVGNSSASMYQTREQQASRHGNFLAYCQQPQPPHYVQTEQVMQPSRTGDAYRTKSAQSSYVPSRDQYSHQMLDQQQYQQYKLAQQQCNSNFIRAEGFLSDSEKMSASDGARYAASQFINSDQIYYDGRAQLDYPMQTLIQSKPSSQQQELYTATRSTPSDSLQTSGFITSQQQIYHQNINSPYHCQTNLSFPTTGEQFHPQNISTIFYSRDDHSSSCPNTTSNSDCGPSSYSLTQSPPTSFFQSNSNYQRLVAGSSSCTMFKSQDQSDHQEQNPQQMKFQMSRQDDQIVGNQQTLKLSSKSTVKQAEDLVNLKSCGSLPQEWLDTICRHLIDHMNRFGICVIDNFMGLSKGNLILKEVQRLYEAGQYTKGRLVSNKLSPKSHINEAATSSIRSDRVIWIDGCEEGCEEINNLIQILCSVIMNSSRLALYSNKGLDKVVISKRTKAHVACYPGDGTRYIKHVDNPNGDGRVITAIYYLNKNWFSKRDGGLLRMFPVGMDEVANIEPLFDRVLFFWSDRRNPHEVLPAFRDRFAITVWYIGEIRP